MSVRESTTGDAKGKKGGKGGYGVQFVFDTRKPAPTRRGRKKKGIEKTTQHQRFGGKANSGAHRQICVLWNRLRTDGKKQKGKRGAEIGKKCLNTRGGDERGAFLSCTKGG